MKATSSLGVAFLFFRIFTPVNNCYIIFSPSLNKYYTGISHVAFEERLLLYNTSGYGNHYTSQAKDWEAFLIINCSCFKQTVAIEKHIKRMKSRIYKENLKKYPEMILKLKEKYKCT